MTKGKRKKFIRDTFSNSEVGVLIEHFEDQVKLIGEQHGTIINKIDSLENRVESLDNKLDKFVVENRSNFKAVFEYLSRIEDDFISLKKKIDKISAEKIDNKDFNWLKDKVLEIEKRLDEYKKQQTALSSGI